VRTDWRRFHLNLTSDFSLNFTQLFGTPMSQWERINYTDSENRTHPAYTYNCTNALYASSYFVLPSTATNIQIVEDTIIFEAPPAPEDAIINSPILILGALIVVNIVVIIYRRLGK